MRTSSDMVEHTTSQDEIGTKTQNENARIREINSDTVIYTTSQTSKPCQTGTFFVYLLLYCFQQLAYLVAKCTFKEYFNIIGITMTNDRTITMHTTIKRQI